MSAYPPPPPPPPGGVGQRIEEAIELIEMEIRHAAAYVNDAVIPQVRRESISAMRTLADTIRSLADRMDRNAGGPNAGGPNAGGPNSGGSSSGGPNSSGSRDPRS